MAAGPVTRRLAILDDIQGVALRLADWEAVRRVFEVEVHRDPLPAGEERARALAPYEVIVAMRERTPFPRELLEALPNLDLLVSTGTWNRAIDMDAAAERDIVVCGTESSPHAPVELTWALILGLARRVHLQDAAMRRGHWQTGMGIELHGKTLGVLGLGRLGTEMARMGKAFGMRVIAWSPNMSAQRAEAAGAKWVPRADLFRLSDVITVQLALSESTRGLVGKRELGLMRRNALLVNTSRGAIIDEDALVLALEAGTIGGAALDVYDIEPLPEEHRLRRAPRTLLTPHIGNLTNANYATYYSQAVEDVLAYLEGKPLRVLNERITRTASRA